MPRAQFHDGQRTRDEENQHGQHPERNACRTHLSGGRQPTHAEDGGDIDQNDIASDYELLIQIADTILTFDILHEEAISMKCKALTALGKHSLAKEIFDKFSKGYSLLYDEPFNRTFTDIIKQ